MSLETEASGLAASVTRAYLKKKFPYSSLLSETPGQWEATRRRFMPWYVLTMILVIVLMPVLTIASAWLLYHLYFAMAKAFVAPHDLFLPVFWPVFSIPGIFMMCIVIGYPIEWIQKVLLGNHFRAFEDYYNAKQGYDNKKAMVWFMRVCTYPFIFLLIPIVTSGIVARSDHFTVKHIYELYPRSYRYADVAEVICYKNILTKKMELRKDIHFTIYVKGSAISIDEIDNDQALLQVLKQKGITVLHKETEIL